MWRVKMLTQRVTLSGRLTTLTRPALRADSTDSRFASALTSENVVPNCSSKWLSEVPIRGSPTA